RCFLRPSADRTEFRLRDRAAQMPTDFGRAADHEELAAKLAQAYAGCESRTAAPRSSLLISGLQAPQLVPAFRRRPTSSTLAAPFWISAEIWCCPTPKQEQTIGPTSWLASSGWPVSSDMRAFGDNACSANSPDSHDRETSL